MMNQYRFQQEQERRERLALFFEAEFGRKNEGWFSAPGRAEMLGNHTDHHLGKAMVSAISCDILCAASPRTDGMVEIRSEEFNPIRFSVNDLGCREREKGKSIALARGVLDFLKRLGYSFGGFSAATDSNIFRGAGVSSSAAFEVLIAQIVDTFYSGGKIPPLDKAKAGKYAENVYFGKPCGLLDQTGVAFGGLHHVDFRTKDPIVTSVPAPKGYRLVLTNTGGSHAALTPHYAEIKREMGEVSAYFSKNVLREVSFGEFWESLPKLRKAVGDRAVLRAFHFFEENDRVDRAARALLDGNTPAFFRQVLLSGESSLKFLQNCYVAGDCVQPVVLAMKMSEKLLKDGAFRMMGGGFTGALLAFVPEGKEEEYKREMGLVFGRENVFETELRETGACEIREI